MNFFAIAAAVILQGAVVSVASAAAPNFSASFGGGDKQAAKASAHWTLADYLAQKSHVRLMDFWLAANRSATFLETSLSGGALQYDLKTTTAATATSVSKTSQAYRASIFVSIFGIEGEYEKTNHDIEAYSGAVALRLLGASEQGTHLTAKYGLRSLTDKGTAPATKWENQFAQGDLAMHLVSFLGVQGNYRYYVPAKSSSGIELKGTRAGAGVFLDMAMVHLFANYFVEKTTQDNAGVKTDSERTGYEYGGRLFF